MNSSSKHGLPPRGTVARQFGKEPLEGDIAARIRDGTFKNLYERAVAKNKEIERDYLAAVAVNEELDADYVGKIRKLVDYFLPRVGDAELPQEVADIIAESEERRYAQSHAAPEEKT